MIIYSGNNKSFFNDVLNGRIAKKIQELFVSLGKGKKSKAEENSWEHSLQRMALALKTFPDDIHVAVEYQIPLTSKRIDVMVGGTDGQQDNVVIVELKQWEKCEATELENVVTTFVGGGYRQVTHPSYQAYSYAKLLENYNEAVWSNGINLIPCAYLHNFQESARGHICAPAYSDIIREAPVFLQEDGDQLVEFLSRFVSKPTNRKLFDIIESGKLKPSKALQDAVGQVLDGNEEFFMIDEQQVAFATVTNLLNKASQDSKKHVVIVEGGPGTGKSVIAVHLLGHIINNDGTAYYVTKTSAPRFVFSEKLVKGRHKIGYLKELFRSSGTFHSVPPDTFDCLIVDESHRLVSKSGMYRNLGENQVMEIIRSARICVFFIDENQIISKYDIGTIDEIKKYAKELGAVVHHDESLKLTSQFRCNGSDGYIAFLDDVLGIRETANSDGFDIDYDIRIFDSPVEMREELRKHNGDNKARMIAGYCYPWDSKNDKKKKDIFLPSGFEAQWNFSTDKFATDPNSFEQVGCIHSTQGLEFDYVGIIIGTDLRYENGSVIADNTRRAKTDKTIKNSKKLTPDEQVKFDQIIRNTYKTLLSRGQKGCFIYCEDSALGEYLKNRLKNRKQPRKTA